MPKIFASIDIGSNAVRLLFANVLEINSQPRAEKATLVRIPVRLGLDVFETGQIGEQRADMLIQTLKAFKLLIEVYEPEGFKACATAAMREAKNNQEILNRIREEAGFEVRIIDGLEEARIISLYNNIQLNEKVDTNLYIDVGGGSTELSVYHKDEFVKSNSFKIGTIRLLNEKVDKEVWDEMKAWVKDVKQKFGEVNCIGSGGNINKLTKLFGFKNINTLSRKQLKTALDTLSKLPLEERIIKYGMRSDRADVIVPAAEIFLKIMKWGDIGSVVAPKFGLADGLAIQQFNDLKKLESA